MCGIAGFIISKPGADSQARHAILDKMCRVITHRGPDEQGTAVIGRAAIGMRRLAIIDLKGGQQPIYNEDGNLAIVFNGEIYNFHELKDDLEKKGHEFKTNSDTETIIHAFEEYGEDCVQYLRGMFAFAIWDSDKESLFIARDRVGKKPLFYTFTDDGTFVFGSELKVLLAHGGFGKEVDPAAMDAFLTFGYVPENYSIFKNVKKLLPGHVLRLEGPELTTREYWDFKYEDSQPGYSENDYIERLRTLLEEAVRVRLISEVPLGAFLSGGIDSSTVVGLMSRIQDRPVKTFSIGFNEDTFDELKYARIAAKHFGTDHHEFIVTPDLVEIVDELVWHFDEPFADPSSLPTYMVSKMARDFVTVVLSGDGGDELFAGYTRYVVDRKRGGVALPGWIRKGFVQPVSEALPHAAKGKNYLYNMSLDPIGRYVDSVSHFNSPKKRSLYSSAFASVLGEQFDSAAADFVSIASGATADDVHKLLYLDSKTYLPSDILTKVDRMSMAVSLEARVPLLDHKLIEFVNTIPSGLKLRGLETKYIFRQAVRGIVPDEILDRPKQGFGVPIEEWINKELREKIRDTLGSQAARSRGYFQANYIETLLSEHEAKRRDHSYSLWMLFMLELWHQKYLDEAHG